MSTREPGLELIDIDTGKRQRRNDGRVKRRSSARRRRQRQRRRRFLICVGGGIFIAAGLAFMGVNKIVLGDAQAMSDGQAQSGEQIRHEVSGEENLAISRYEMDEEEPAYVDAFEWETGEADVTELLREKLKENEELADFVENYPDRRKYRGKTIDLSEDYTPGEVPLLMQWDQRWGYDLYGDELIGLAGCGPVCLAMAYLYHTGDTSMNPRKMAEFAEDNGYYTENGTSWDFWTEGVAKLGMIGEACGVSETNMKTALDNGGVIICSMAPGDFTDGGHFILIRGYDSRGFYVNDPNRKSTSNKQWTYQQLWHQIKGLWAIYSGD